MILNIDLPGVIVRKQDGNLTIQSTNSDPKTVIIGTAKKGPSNVLYRVVRPSIAENTFGKDGDLIRGMHEAKAGGATNILLYRIGATAAVVTGVGHIGAGSDPTLGKSIEILDKGPEHADNYTIWFDPDGNTDSSPYLVVKNDDRVVVYSNKIGSEIDTGDVIVGGTFGTGANLIGTEIGTQGVDPEDNTIAEPGVLISAVSTLEAVPGIIVNDPTDGVTEYQGSNGNAVTGELPLRHRYEHLFLAYEDLRDSNIDFIVPMTVYLDSRNYAEETDITDITNPLNYLTYFNATRTNGVWVFTWDNAKGAAGTGVSSDSDYHAVNFAQQLATFCWQASRYFRVCHGVIGTRPPISKRPQDIALWLGTAPTITVNSNGSETIASSGDNGTGLLGNKFMGGKDNYRSGHVGGGFVATDDGYIDGTELEDEGGHIIDLGKYVSVVCTWPEMSNSFSSQRYIANGSAEYAGKVSTLPSNSAPTLKEIRFAREVYKLRIEDVNDLVQSKYVVFHNDPIRGYVIADAMTAALKDSDYQRFMTFNGVKEVIETVRLVSNPYLGEINSAASRIALRADIALRLNELKKASKIQKINQLNVSSTRNEQILGLARMDLQVVMPGEMRKIDLVFSVAADVSA